MLVSNLPDRLSQEQKRRKVSNLLQELRRSGQIVKLGSLYRPRWSVRKVQRWRRQRLGRRRQALDAGCHCNRLISRRFRCLEPRSRLARLDKAGWPGGRFGRYHKYLHNIDLLLY